MHLIDQIYNVVTKIYLQKSLAFTQVRMSTKTKLDLVGESILLKSDKFLTTEERIFGMKIVIDDTMKSGEFSVE